MGMNIYTSGGRHVGKRSAAGFWCWDCKVQVESKDQFFTCPNCGLKVYETIVLKGFNPAYRELGFDKEKEVKRSGISGASHFTWHAENKEEAEKRLRRVQKFKTEYGDYWSKARFKRMFNEVIEESFINSDFS